LREYIARTGEMRKRKRRLFEVWCKGLWKAKSTCKNVWKKTSWQSCAVKI